MLVPVSTTTHTVKRVLTFSLRMLPASTTAHTLKCVLITYVFSICPCGSIYYRMAKDGLLFEAFATLNKHGVPVFGTIVTGVIAGVIGFLFDIETLTRCATHYPSTTLVFIYIWGLLPSDLPIIYYPVL